MNREKRIKKKVNFNPNFILGANVAQKFEEIAQKKFMGPMTAALQKEKKGDEEALYNNYMKTNNVQNNQGDQKDGQDIDWENCDYHADRIKHFYCTSHQNLCCRVCKDVMHSRQECMVVDLYETDDIQGFLNEMAEMEKEKNLFQGK